MVCSERGFIHGSHLSVTSYRVTHHVICTRISRYLQFAGKAL